ncbi:MAG: isocitrate/isopropylmalate dehydrogenase family protein [Dehalococcoidia bacterium]|nr:isocitrate/isopropylmalate dehydrogenase family protein [Dehalococcoidia bacterium]
MAYEVTLIPGDGVGPEIAEATVKVLEATGVKFNWDRKDAGAKAQEMFGSTLPAQTLESIKRNKVALKGPVTTPVGSGFRSVNVALRQELDLYACLRPCKTYTGAPTYFNNLDIVVVRENTEDLYAGIEFKCGSPEAGRLIKLTKDTLNKTVRPDSAISLKVISETGSKRIVEFAFNYARQNGRKKVSAIHKANIMKYSDGLFLEAARGVAKEYPDIEFEDVLVDTLCMRLVRWPQQFDVIVLPNLYGDIISDLCAGLIGGLGLAPGANIGKDTAVFEATHGSAPKYAGKNRVNPFSLMLSAVMMLKHLGEREAASRVEEAISQVVFEGKDVTYDLKPRRDDPSAATTSRAAEAVIERLRKS